MRPLHARGGEDGGRRRQARRGNGGNGATGGEGGVSGDGGGGGSGYTDDTFDIINAELGGNTTTSSSVTFQVVT